jgi:hypothetical protein
MSRETAIEDAVIRQPGILGFPQADAIRNVRVGLVHGRVDLMLLPRRGRTKLVLVEAKHSTATDAVSKVIGQLFMYYSGARDIGLDGLSYFRDFARDNPEAALSSSPVSGKALTGLSPATAAWARIARGRKLGPDEIAIFVALNAPPHEALQLAVRRLRKDHGLKVGICVAGQTGLRLLVGRGSRATRGRLQIA